jgi:hypothetical protein
MLVELPATKTTGFAAKYTIHKNYEERAGVIFL